MPDLSSTGTTEEVIWLVWMELDLGNGSFMGVQYIYRDSNPSSSEDSDDNEIQTCELTRSANESMHELDANVSDVQIENQEQDIYRTTRVFAPKAAKKSSKLVDTVNTSTSAKEAFEMMKSVYQKTQTTETRDKYSILGELVGHTIHSWQNSIDISLFEPHMSASYKNDYTYNYLPSPQTDWNQLFDSKTTTITKSPLSRDEVTTGRAILSFMVTIITNYTTLFNKNS
ncbi:unnamed protein product [Acanthoscelides obtectus]|uniref:Uncharacterized protein n=1 Tax=Acanthoscelides obtectus TaxID=200917 RepID=A0A9P0PAU7_ACAOB|nr:unnamed protein product [Acanthoscelides obtectus]CAK1667650.1 hypothetical protein AOBTE_LOCUS25969 [Acanthoscelides obtectus]